MDWTPATRKQKPYIGLIQEIKKALTFPDPKGENCDEIGNG